MTTRHGNTGKIKVCQRVCRTQLKVNPASSLAKSRYHMSPVHVTKASSKYPVKLQDLKRGGKKIQVILMTYLAALPLNYFVTLGLPCKKSGKCGCRLVYLPCRGPGAVTSDCPSATSRSARKEMNTLWLAGSSSSKFGSSAKLKKGERTTTGK